MVAWYEHCWLLWPHLSPPPTSILFSRIRISFGFKNAWDSYSCMRLLFLHPYTLFPSPGIFLFYITPVHPCSCWPFPTLAPLLLHCLLDDPSLTSSGQCFIFMRSVLYFLSTYFNCLFAFLSSLSIANSSRARIDNTVWSASCSTWNILGHKLIIFNWLKLN